jgi:putative toxin-antitoxin system antitoxin component (TIGR02293 family)
MQVAEQQAVYHLGGSKALGRTVDNLIDLAELIEAGVPRRAADTLRDHLQLSEQEWARSLGVSTKTLQRQSRDGQKRLTLAQGDRLYRLARIVALAEEVFEDAPRTRDWLREPQRGLGNRAPLDLLQTEAGAREVEDLLGRIEYGVLS